MWSISGNTKHTALADLILGGDAMSSLVAIGRNILFLNPEYLDTLTGLGLVVGIDHLVYEEGLEPRPRYVAPLEDDDCDDEDYDEDWG